MVREDYERYLATGPEVALRDQHGREDATLRGQLVVRGDVPDDYAHGLFGLPGASYNAIVRFSPNSALPLPRDAHGMAIKVMGAGEQDQDFILANSPVFIAKDARACLELMRAKHDGKIWSMPWYLARGLRVREAFNILPTVGQHVPNPLAVDYYSGTAMSCGPTPVRMVVEAWSGLKRPTMEEQLETRGASFDVRLQRCPDDLVDDPTKKCRTPRTTVAALHLPPQEPISGEDFSFSLSHHSSGMLSLGQVAAVREAVYPVIFQMRHEYNLRHGADT